MDMSFVYTRGYVEGTVTYRLMGSKERTEYSKVSRIAGEKRDEVEAQREVIEKEMRVQHAPLLTQKMQALKAELETGHKQKWNP